jgi:hypothetical protein
MKKAFLIGIIILAFTHCEKPKVFIDPNVFFLTSSGLNFKYDDIELYDSSTHILYLKKSYNEFKDVLTGIFAFLDNGDTIYKGYFWPPYLNSMPVGPFIQSPSNMYGDYALRIERWYDNKPDVRNCERIIEVLKNHSLLHSGLSGSINSIKVTDSILSFNFSIINKDQSDLLILDLNKTGTQLFHYFTNGLYIRDINNHDVFSSNITFQQPDPWNSFKTDWLSLIKSRDTLSFTIIYKIENSLTTGEYNALFEFPGLAYQVTKDQLFQNRNMIWLGDISLMKKIIIP